MRIARLTGLRCARALLGALLIALVLVPGARAGTHTGTAGVGGAASTTTASAAAHPTGSVTTVTRTETVTTTPGTPVLVTDKTTPPVGYHHTALQVLAIARRSPVARAELRTHPGLVPYEYTKGAPQWQVSWFTPPRPGVTQRELVQVYVDDGTGRVTQAWTGFQVAWTMARGYPGAFGRIVNAWYIWLPFCLLFALPFLPWRRRPSLLHLDLAMFLFFSVSLAFFNHADIGLSTPLFYVPLLYLLVRLLALAWGIGVPREPLRTIVAPGWLLIGVALLMAFRIGLNVLDSNVIDVGFSGVIGADKLIHNVPLYGHWPANDAYGDTYAPLNYLAYVPFRLVLGWSGAWDSLPAAHGAAIFFDVATLVALYALGRRWRDHALGVVLAYAWAAYPFTMWSLSSNTNDSLVALTVTLALLALGSAPARGAMSALAGMTKFAPFILTPLLLRGAGERPRRRDLILFSLPFLGFVILCMLPVLLKGDLGPFWHDSIRYQSDRDTPFSVWGLWGGLGWLQHILQGAVVALALIVSVLPRRRDRVQVAALAGALLIALQLVTNYWLYSYIVWFFPPAIVALFASHPPPGAHLEAAWRELEDRRLTVPALPVEPAG
ncbi:MAG TPA: hypothetical protein VFN65_11830 [Solirubrobacteraceae bacterium]|nr:hypothetical protein [Solirubrobacteraceae bacterium]